MVWYLGLQKALPTEWKPLAYYVVVGGIGGVTAVFFGLYRHASLRDFDAGFLLWYYLKPAIGMVIGPIVYLAGMAGLLATTGKAEVQSHFLLLTAAFVTGFSERFSLSLIDKIGEMVFGTPETPTKTESLPQPSPQVTGTTPGTPETPAKSQEGTETVPKMPETPANAESQPQATPSPAGE